MSMNHYLAGVGKALLFHNDNLIGVGKTYTQSTFSFSATPEEIRAGEGNSLWGQFFHDSNLSVSIQDAMFKLEYLALKLGVNIEQGGLSVYESTAGETTAEGGVITVKDAPVAFDGTIMAWYKKPGMADWAVTTQVSGNKITIPRAEASETYCVKYFYQNPNARMFTIPAQFNPSELHVVLLHDLYNADSGAELDMAHGSKVGRLITDIPRLLLDPNAELNLTPTSSAPVDFGGTALAVDASVGCEEDAYYGTMTEEIYGAKWENNVIALAVENGDMSLKQTSGKETAIVRVLYTNSPAQRKDNSNFTFTVVNGSSASVGENTGIVQALGSPGKTVISVKLTENPAVEPAFICVDVSGGV